MGDFSSKRFASNSCYARRLSHLLKLQTSRNTGPPGIIDNVLRFPGKSKRLQTHVFNLDHLVEHWGGWHNNKQKCHRQKKNLWHRWKNWKMCWGARQLTAFKIMIWVNCWCFCFKAGTCVKKRKPYF